MVVYIILFLTFKMLIGVLQLGAAFTQFHNLIHKTVSTQNPLSSSPGPRGSMKLKKMGRVNDLSIKKT